MAKNGMCAFLYTALWRGTQGDHGEVVVWPSFDSTSTGSV